MPPALRQSAANSTGSTPSTNTIAVTLGSAVLAGSRLVVYGVAGNTTTSPISGVSDTINGAWPAGGKIANSFASEAGGPTEGELWELKSSAAGAAPTITITFSVAQTFKGIIAHEITGLDTSVFADTASARSQASLTAWTTANITPSVNGCYLLCCCSNDVDTVVPTRGGAFTLRNNTTTNQIVASEDQVQGAAAAIAGAFTFSAAKSGTIHVVAFRPAPTASLPRPAITMVRSIPADASNVVLLLRNPVTANPPVVPSVPQGNHVYIISQLPVDPFPGGVMALKAAPFPMVGPPPVSRFTLFSNVAGDPFAGGWFLLKPAPQLVGPPPNVRTLFANLDGDPFAGKVWALQNAQAGVPPVTVAATLPPVVLYLNPSGDAFPGSVTLLKASSSFTPDITPSSLALPATRLVLNTDGDTFPGAVLLFKASSSVTPDVPPPLPLPAVLLFLNTAGDTFPGSTLVRFPWPPADVVVDLPPPPPQLQVGSGRANIRARIGVHAIVQASQTSSRVHLLLPCRVYVVAGADLARSIVREHVIAHVRATSSARARSVAQIPEWWLEEDAIISAALDLLND